MALHPVRRESGGGIEMRLSNVERRVDAIESKQTRVEGLMKEVRDAVGRPAKGADAATGIYAFVDAVSARLTWFEKLRERGIGALAVGVPILAGSGVLLWFLSGERITKLLGG